MYFIYALYDPIEPNHFRYIGQSKVGPKRPNYHALEGHRPKKKTHKLNWIRQIQSEGREPEWVILEACTNISDLNDSEICYILACRALCHKLTNTTAGGLGHLGHHKSIEERRKISEALKGKPKSPEHIAKLPQNRPGWKHSPEAIAKIKANNRGHRWTSAEAKEIKGGYRYGLGNKSRTGQTQSPEERAKKSLAQKGKPKTDQHRKRIASGQLRFWGRMTKEERRVELLKRGLLKKGNPSNRTDTG